MYKMTSLLALATAITLPLSASTAARYAHLPLSFEPNHGQTTHEVRFLSRGSGYTLFLTDSEAVMSLAKGVVRMRVVGASKASQIEGQNELRGKVNYFRDGESKTNILTYARVAYREVYPGIDLLFYGNQRQL